MPKLNFLKAHKNNFLKKNNQRDFPGGLEADSVLSMQGAQVQSLVRKLDPHATTKSLHAATKAPVCHS